MPLTAAAFLVGSVAIVGLPPLNGFVSEWVVFQALLRSGEATTVLRVASVAAAGLGLIGALALACFTKVHGVVFLGHDRTPGAARAVERGPGSLGPMLILAGICLVLGVVPAAAVVPATKVGLAIVALPIPAGEPIGLEEALPVLTMLAAGVTLLAALLWLARGRRLSGTQVARAGTWACAYPRTTARMQYSASSYAAPLLTVLRPVSGVRVEADAGRFQSHPIDPVLDGAVLPTWRRIVSLAGEARLLQAGRLRWYLLYLILTLLTLLLYLGR
jgi:hydrogenase-4 component B